MPTIPELPADTVADAADTLLIYDAATSKTKRITVAEFLAAISLTTDDLPDFDAAVNALVAAGGSIAVTQSAHGLVVGNVVYYNGTAWVKGKADDPETAYAHGVVSVVTDANHFSFIAQGLISGLSGLTAGKTYFLSDVTAGAVTASAPYTNATVIKPVLVALSATTAIVRIEQGSVNVVTRAYGQMGINFGYSLLSDTDQIKHDLQYVGRYTRKLRFTIPSYDDATGIANVKVMVAIARDMGFETTYGVTAAGFGHNAAYIDGWMAAIPGHAAWADANGVDIFYIGNEEDWFATPAPDGPGGITGYTPADIQDMVLDMAVTLKAAYPNLQIVYSTSEGTIVAWDALAADGRFDSLDALGINSYNADFDGTLDYMLTLGFASKMYLSEWNDEQNYPDGGKSAAAYRAIILERRRNIEARGIKAYFFTFDWGGAYGTGDDWGLSNGDGTYKPGLEQIFSIPR